MARLRFPGRPGYRFDRIGIRYGADEARQTTDPTLAIVASIHKGLKRFRDLFGDSDEDELEFDGFSPEEIKSAELQLKRAIEKEKKNKEKQVEEQIKRYERSQATLASLEAQGVELPQTIAHVSHVSRIRRTFRKIVQTGLFVETSERHTKPKVLEVHKKDSNIPKLNGAEHVLQDKSSHDSQTSESHPAPQPRFRRPVGRPKKIFKPPSICDYSNGEIPETQATSVFGSKTASKYTSAAKQILARATKQAALSSNRLFLSSSHKVGKFVLPTKSSRSSRVIKPNKRFIEDDTIHDSVTKQPKLNTPPPSLPPLTSIFSLDASEDKFSTFSPFQTHGLALSPFSMNREKGFPAFSAAPQPSGTSSFTDSISYQKPLGTLDQPLIIEGKRPRKPSLIMRMKLVEDDPEDEVRLQQQLSDTFSPTKTLGGLDDEKLSPDLNSPPSSQLGQKYGSTKSLIAPAKLFTGSSHLLSKQFKFNKGGLHGPSQNTVVIRQPKLQLNRTALNRSKAALARSLKAQLKREAKLERRKRKSQKRIGMMTSAAHSPGSTLAQLSPFSKLLGESAIEKHKSGLFEGIEAGAGSFSPRSFSTPLITSSNAAAGKLKGFKDIDYQSTLIKEEDLLKKYVFGVDGRCLVCSILCDIKKNRKLPKVPLCERCKKAYCFKIRSGRIHMTTCSKGGRCNVHFAALKDCSDCRFMKFRAVLSKSKALGLPFKELNITCTLTDSAQKEDNNFSSDCEIKDEVTNDHYVNVKLESEMPMKKHRHKSGEGILTDNNVKSKIREALLSPSRDRQKFKNEEDTPSKGCLNRTSRSLNSSNLDQPLSVDVGAGDESISLSPSVSSVKTSPSRMSKSSASKKAASDEAEDDMEDADTSRGTSRGPRIKHVCRRAAMVFPQQRATFSEDIPKRATLTLSALPAEEKQQLLAKAKSKRDEAADTSSDEDNKDIKPFPKLQSLKSPREDTLTEQRSREHNPDIKPFETDAPKKRGVGRPRQILSLAQKVRKKNLVAEKRNLPYKRKIRCRECKGCMTPECGVCVFCRDKPKFGGPGKIKKCCIHSVCLAPKIPRKAYTAFIEPKSPPRPNWRDDDDNSGDYRPTNKLSSLGSSRITTRFQGKETPNSYHSGQMDGGKDGTKDDGEETDDAPEAENQQPGLDRGQVSNLHRRRKFRHGKGMKFRPVEATVQFALTDIRNPFLSRLPGNFRRRLGGLRKNLIASHKQQYSGELKPVQNKTAYCYDVPLKTHFIRADYKGSSDVNSVWFHGFAITLTGTTCVRTLCYLCGSAGKQELIFCIVCCQPYHNFCLEEDERPDEPAECDDGEEVNSEEEHHGAGSILSWCCRRCQFCHVCGQQNGLLKCHRCKDTYHPECLGPNYPTRPSRKNIWVCTKCVRCKSCGATTPGVGTNATWTYDFSLCYDCGKLMDKGNFCPVCHKCYSDDDWESKMVQCAICESWVHAKCEELTDEMYQLVSLLPEEVQFTCRVCVPEKPAYWERVLKYEFSSGLNNVLNSLLSSKCAQLLLEAGSPKEVKTIRHLSKGKSLEDSRGSDTEISFNDETAAENTTLVLHMLDTSDGSSREPMGLQGDSAVLVDKKIVEKCDCDGARPENINGNRECMDSEKIPLIRRNGFSMKSCSLAALSDFSVIKPSSATQGPVSAQLLDALAETRCCDNQPLVEGGSLTAENKLKSICAGDFTENTQSLSQEDSKPNCDIISLKSGSNTCDSMSPRSILSNSDSSSNTASPMITANLCSAEQNLNSGALPPTFCLDLNQRSIMKNLFPAYSPLFAGLPAPSDLNPAKGEAVECTGVALHMEDKDETDSTVSGGSHLQKDDITDTTLLACLSDWDANGEHPRDFKSIKDKIDAGKYTSVEEFSEDMVRIIQALLCHNENFPTRKKQANSVRSIFVKQMQRLFPWFNINTCKLWEHNRSLPEGMLKNAVVPPSSDHNYARWMEKRDSPMCPQPSPFKKTSPKKSPSAEDTKQVRKTPDDVIPGEDTRVCLLCGGLGDDLANHAGRLLYCGQDDWVHINCALWSAEVFESHSGLLQNVQEAVSRGKKLKCDLCQQLGATVGCCAPNCRANYHFMCARKDECAFLVDQTLFCRLHKDLAEVNLVKEGGFGALRRVCVDMEKLRSKSQWGKAVDPSTLSVIIGSCTVEQLGILNSFMSDTEECLYPIDFCSTRIYWSTQDTRRRCVYTCRIIEVKPVEFQELHIPDMRIIHDESHAEYVPLDQLALGSLGIPNFIKPALREGVPSSRNEPSNLLYSHNRLEGCDKNEKENPAHLDSPRCEETLHSNLDLIEVQGSKSCKLIAKPIDLSGLSPSTLALLNIKDAQNYIPPSKSPILDILPTVDEELVLVQIANRLNNAASSKQGHGSSSMALVPKIPHGGLVRSQSVSSSPVSFKHQGRQRASSEERYLSPLSPLASTNAVARVNLSIPPVAQHFRAISESPFTSIRCQDDMVLQGEGPLCGLMCSDVADQGKEAGESTSICSDEINAERIKTILENVPADVLEADNVKVVLVTEPGDLSEEEIMNLTLSVLESSEGCHQTNSNDWQAQDGECEKGNDQLTRGDHFTGCLEETGVEKGKTPQDKSTEGQEVSSEQGHRQLSTLSCLNLVGHGGTDEDDGEDDDKKPLRDGTKKEISDVVTAGNRMEKAKKLKPVDEGGNEKADLSPVCSDIAFDDVAPCPVPQPPGSPSDTTGLQHPGCTLTGNKDQILLINDDKQIDSVKCSKSKCKSADHCAEDATLAGTQLCATKNLNLGPSKTPLALSGEPPQTSEEDSDYVMLDDFSHSETNDEDEQKSGKLVRRTCQSSSTLNPINNKSTIAEAVIVTEKDDTAAKLSSTGKAVDPNPDESTSKHEKGLDIFESFKLKQCYVSLEKHDIFSPRDMTTRDKNKNSANSGDNPLQAQKSSNKKEEGAEVKPEVKSETDCEVASGSKDSNKVRQRLTSLLSVKPENAEKDITSIDQSNEKFTSSTSSMPMLCESSVSKKVEHKAEIRNENLAGTIVSDCGHLDINSSGDEHEADCSKDLLEAGSIFPRTRSSAKKSQNNDGSLHEIMVEKIKAKSLERSSPGQEGPFRCPTCKRMYRTKESYEKHVKGCDFEVSTSDEDEKPASKQLRSSASKLRQEHKLDIPLDRLDKQVLPSSPLNVPLSIVISDEFRDDKFSPSSSKDNSDDCSSSAQSQDSRRSSLRKSTVTQRNAAPAHLAKLRRRDSKSTLSPEGSSCSSLLSPSQSSLRLAEDKPSPKETMLEAVGLVSRRTLELSPHSDMEASVMVKLQPRISPVALDEAPKREKKSPAQAGPGGNLRPSIMAGGLPKSTSSKQKSVTIDYNPEVLEEVTISSRRNRPRPKRVWWVEASQSSSDDEQPEDDNNGENDSDDEETVNDLGVACRTRNRLSGEQKVERRKQPKIVPDPLKSAQDRPTEDVSKSPIHDENDHTLRQIDNGNSKTDYKQPLSCNTDSIEDFGLAIEAKGSESNIPKQMESHATAQNIPDKEHSKTLEPHTKRDIDELICTPSSTQAELIDQSSDSGKIDELEQQLASRDETRDEDDMDVAEDTDGALSSPVRRSRRSASKSAKLNEFLAELKKDDNCAAVSKVDADTSPVALETEKRGRGRPRIYPKKVECTGVKRGRGRPRFNRDTQIMDRRESQPESMGIENKESIINTGESREEAVRLCQMEEAALEVTKQVVISEAPDSASSNIDLAACPDISISESAAGSTPRQREVSDASADGRSDRETNASLGNSSSMAFNALQGLSASSSTNGSTGEVKDNDAGNIPPSIHSAIDSMKLTGQKLRFIIRSPNIDAAQKIGELIKKRAMATSGGSSEIIVTTVEPKQAELAKAAPEVVHEKTNRVDDRVDDPLGLRSEAQKDAMAVDSQESEDVSRSVSPDSISAAYDIQSDDFSSETSNDADDYPAASSCESGKVEGMEKTGTLINNNSKKVEPESCKISDDDDDDVVIVKAVGLQPQESRLSHRGPPTSTFASALLSGMASTYSSSSQSSQKNALTMLKYLSTPSPQPCLPLQQPQQRVSQPSFTQPALSISPTVRSLGNFVNIHNRHLSPSKTQQPQVVISDVSPMHFLLQQNQRQDLISAQDLTGTGLLLQSGLGQQRMYVQSSSQPGLIFNNSNSSGLALQGTNQSSVIFSNSISHGLILQQGNPTILQGQPALIPTAGQSGLSFVSLATPNALGSTIISSLQPHSAGLLHPNLNLGQLVHATALAPNPPVVIGQNYLTSQTSMLLASQPMATQSPGMDLVSQQISPKPSPRPTPIVIDPHAHMISSGLNPSMLKAQPASTSQNQPVNPGSRFNLSPNQSLAVTSLGSSKSLTVSQQPTISLANTPSTSASHLPKSTPVVARLDGAPTQVNYMGCFDLNSSGLQSVFQPQQLNKDTSSKISELVQRAISSKGQESIPGVEVKSSISNTPEGPRQVYSVIINEKIWPVDGMKNMLISGASSGVTLSTSSPAITSILQNHFHENEPQKTSEPDWTKLLPSSSLSAKLDTSTQPNSDSLWSGSGFISIPIGQVSGSGRPPFRRALKPSHPQSHKRKIDETVSTEEPPVKRPVYGKTLKPDGTYAGTFQQVVGRDLVDIERYEAAVAQQQNQPCSSSDIKALLAKDSNSANAVTSTDLTKHLLQSPHRRASFPTLNVAKKFPASTQHPSNLLKERVRKQIFKKNLLKKDMGSPPAIQGFKSPETEIKSSYSRRLKTFKESHHPLIHHKAGNVELPQPMLEEEVVATPLIPCGREAPTGPAVSAERMKSQSRLRFEISSDDGFACQGDTVDEAWNLVLEKVQDVRAASRMKQLSYTGISGRSMFGVDHDAVVYLIEQLYGAVHCHRNYKFKFHKYDLDRVDAEVEINPSGSARSEAFSTRKPFDMFNFLKSAYRTKPGDDEREKEEEMALKSSRRATSLSLPMAMRFRKLKTFAKEAVDVYRSKIHGRGLFCKRNIDAGEMVIEYAGEVIRASLTDKREKYYESRGIGCYMFRIDDDEVVDATMHGSAARFINHSCEPNCFSKVILVDGKKHIVIFAMRPIKRGEELTYDYKFPIEEVKIPCSCGSKRCRKYLN